MSRLLLSLATLFLSIYSFAQPPTVTAVFADYNGYQVSCAGYDDGAIDLTVTGGDPPYDYEWSTGAGTQDVQGLAAGYVSVTVYDAGGQEVRMEFTLTEPGDLYTVLTANHYPNGYNVSCYNCYNGSIDQEPAGGVAPYTHVWDDGPTSEDRSGIGATDFRVTVTDANGCKAVSETIDLNQPERSDWTMFGNSNSVPGPHFIGTKDNKDVVFKTLDQERFRLLNDGGMQIKGLDIGSDGILKIGPGGTMNVLPLDDALLQPAELFPFWRTGGNLLSNTAGQTAFLGSRDNEPLRIMTNNIERAIVTKEGKVGIGTTPPSGAISDYRLYVEDGVATREVKVLTATWPDYVFEEDYELMSLSELQTFIDENNHLPHIPSAQEIKENEGAELGDVQRKLLRTVEELTIYILELEERIKELESTNTKNR